MNFPKRTLLKIIKEIKNNSILDIGSAGQGNIPSSGQWLFDILRQNSKSIKGIDPAPCVDEDIIQASIEKLELKEQFDVITMFDVIEHLDNVGLALNNIKKHLKPEGKLILTTPNAISIGNFIDVLCFRFRGVCGNSTHTLTYNEKMLKHILKKYGFKVTKLNYEPFALFGNQKSFKKVLSAARCIAMFPFLLIWKEFSPTLYVIAVKGKYEI